MKKKGTENMDNKSFNTGRLSTVVFLKNLDPVLRQQFKTWCTRRNVTMAKQFETMIRTLLSKDRVGQEN